MSTNISRSKGNKTIELDQFIEFTRKKQKKTQIFLEKS